MADWKAKQAARDAAAAALRAANPHLVAVDGKGGALVVAAKNMRIELARAYPGVKFSVKSRRFSGGDAIDVRWTDGPNSDQVAPIINQYEAGTFNGSDDSYEYNPSAWRDAFGDAKYVQYSRQLSAKAIASAIRTLRAKYATELVGVDDQITVEAYENNKLWGVPAGFIGGRGDLQGAISKIAYARTWAIDRTPKAVEMDDIFQEIAA